MKRLHLFDQKYSKYSILNYYNCFPFCKLLSILIYVQM